MDIETQGILLKLKNDSPHAFKEQKVLEIGSLNLKQIDGFSVRELFDDCEYTGVDMTPGADVDVVGHLADIVDQLDDAYNFILCLNCLEHDIRWRETVLKALNLLTPGGIILFHTPTKLSMHQFMAFVEASKVFEENSDAASLLNPEMHWQPTAFLVGVNSDTHTTSDFFKSETGAFSSDTKMPFSQTNQQNSLTLAKKFLEKNPSGVHVRNTWNYTVQHNVHMTKPGEYYSNVSSGEFLELLVMNNIFSSHNIQISVNKSIGLTFTALIQKKPL
jgi:hypothetical protein